MRRRLLAGIIQSPSAWDPKIYPENALARRNLVLEKMYEQDYISHEQMVEGQQHALPSPSSIEPPTFESKAPYFVAYLRQQLLERYGASKAFYGGLKVKSTLDLQLQEAAEETIASYLGYLPATASVVVIDNHNAAIKALVGGTDFKESAVQPRDPGAPPARVLDQALHAADRARRGDLARHHLRIGGPGIPLRQARQRNLRRPQRRGLLPRVLLDRMRDDLLRQLDLRPARPRRAGRQDGRGPDALDREDDPRGRLQRPDLDQPGDGPRRAQRRRQPARLGLRLHRRSATTATASAAPSPRSPATAPSPSPK